MPFPLTPPPGAIVNRPRLSGAVLDPDDAVRPAEIAQVAHWQHLVDTRRIGTAQPLAPDIRAGIDAWERVLGVGAYRGR